MKQLRVQGTTFVDTEGNEVILNGICLICREPEKGYLEPGIEDILPRLARAGMNCIRLGIFWDGVEPQPGVYDDAYLDRVAEVVRLAGENGIYVFLDMHQDLFSRKFIDGAPEWATLDDGLPHPEGCNVWYEAYVQSPAVITTADSFWANRPAADGVGLIDHYAAMWAHIARRFKDFDNLMGLEPMNEPYMGSLAPKTFEKAIAALRQENPEFDLAKPDKITPEETAAMQGIMTEAFMAFDRDTLMPFYAKMLAAVRSQSGVPLVTGGNIYSSAFVKTGIGRLTRPDGAPETQQIYAPHGYDAVVDTDRYDAYNKDNVTTIFAEKRASQLEMGLPVIVGEWGNFPSGAYTNDLLRHMNRILEDYLWGSTYHQYVAGMLDDANYQSLTRGYPAQVCGSLQSYRYDYDTGRLAVAWQARAGGTSRFFLPNITRVTADRIPRHPGLSVSLHPMADSDAGYVHIVADRDEMLELEI